MQLLTSYCLLLRSFNYLSLQRTTFWLGNERKALTSNGGHVPYSSHTLSNEWRITRFLNAPTKNEKLNAINTDTTANVRYIKILSNIIPKLSKIATVVNSFCLVIPKRDLIAVNNKPNIEACQKASVKAMLEFSYIEQTLFLRLKWAHKCLVRKANALKGP